MAGAGLALALAGCFTAGSPAWAAPPLAESVRCTITPGQQPASLLKDAGVECIFQPGQSVGESSLDEAALARAQTLIAERNAVVADVEKQLGRGEVDPARDRLWGDSVLLHGNFGTHGYYTSAMLSYQDRRGEGDPIGIRAEMEVGCTRDVLKSEDFHPESGGSWANRLGNLAHRLGLPGVARYVHSFDRGPRDRQIEHVVSGRPNYRERTVLLHDGTIRYSVSEWGLDGTGCPSPSQPD
ncbi:MAG: hypothetical protein AB1758_05565 [Candidatus Eremiobacterota bacterium]